jgi:chromate reductase
MEDKIHIVAMLGSLRSGSFNKIVLNSAIELCPQGASIEIAEIGNLPLYNGDFEGNMPQEVRSFKEKIKSADSILIVTPEYNYSIPGGLKNALDWGSRPYGDSSFDKKPVGVMTASPGSLGGSRCQYHLRQAFVFLNMFPMNVPEMIIGSIQDKTTEDGKLKDQHSKDKILEYLNALIDWSKKIKSIT